MLFKYLSALRVDVLSTLTIRFTPLLSLNDPFESLPLIDMKGEKDRLIQETIQGLEDLWRGTKEEEKTKENLARLESTRIELLSQIENTLKDCKIGREIVAMLGDSFGVLSLTRTEKSILMWSHYADEGRGFVIGFDDKHPFFHEKDSGGRITAPKPVVYSSVRSKVKPRADRFYEKLLCEKALEWAYEEEERIFRFFEDKSSRSIGKDSNDQDIVLTPLPKEAICAVYLGYRVDKKLEMQLLEAIRKNEILCKVYRTSMCDNQYKIVFDEL